jgi:hypothetical protein
MAPPQITGTASTYARKRALEGLFLLDNEKDIDSKEVQDAIKNSGQTAQNRPQATQKQNAGTSKGSKTNGAQDEMRAKAIKALNAEIERTGVAGSEVANIAKAKYGKGSVKEMTTGQICDLANKLEQFLLDQINEASA